MINFLTIKEKTKMRSLKTIGFGLMIALGMASCSKSDTANVSVAYFQAGSPVSDTTSGGSIKGTMSANKTYTITRDVIVNQGDTLVIQPGVTLNIKNGSSFIVRGTLLSLGTQANPITFTDPSKVMNKGYSCVNNVAGWQGSADSAAYAGGWGGIYCDSTSNLLVIKWTHLNFPGHGVDVSPFSAVAKGKQYTIWFGSASNDNAVFILEDSWIYGCPDDIIRNYGGNVYMVRNTVEKFGGTGGDGFNPKGNTQGVMAYNLFIGGATNATKSSSDGHTDRKCMIAMFNNTYIDCGHRSTLVNKTGLKGGCIEIENNSRAWAFNNLIVDCRYGLRVAGGTGAKVNCADTALGLATDFIPQTAYGYNYYYGDDDSLTSQFVPTNVAQDVATYPTNNGIPNMYNFFANTLKVTYGFGLIYDGSALVQKNNPMFANYTLPNLNYMSQASVDNYNFHLASGSPAIGAGITTPLPHPQSAGNGYYIPVSANFGATYIVSPGADMGCYQTNGTAGNGNLH